jgi:hypothetical protein
LPTNNVKTGERDFGVAMKMEFNESNHTESVTARFDSAQLLPDMRAQSAGVPVSTSRADVMQREQELFGSGVLDLNAFDTTRSIYGGRGDFLASKSQQTDASDKIRNAKKPHEKSTPKDGDHLTLKQLLHDYKTPFIDAYERSKQLKDGAPGKSKTLEEIVDRLKACPWADQILIDFKLHPNNPEYSNQSSTITIDLADPPQKQIENFAHEAFHATHQFLSTQYDNGKLNKADYVNVWLGGEVESMLVERNVHRELGLQGESPRFKYVEHGQVKNIDIDDYVNKHGKEGLREFLRVAQPTGQTAEPYGEHYAKFYNRYLQFFNQNKPAVEKYVHQWLESGHRREDI